MEKNAVQKEDYAMKKRILAALLCAGLVAFAPVGTTAQTLPGGYLSRR